MFQIFGNLDIIIYIKKIDECLNYLKKHSSKALTGWHQVRPQSSLYNPLYNPKKEFEECLKYLKKHPWSDNHQHDIYRMAPS